MTSTPIAPRLLKGAILGIDKMNPAASVVVFQYNPDTITRRLEARAAASDDSDRGEAARLVGPPRETITVTVEVDAADQPGGAATAVGVHPPLAALEMLLYPKSLAVFANAALAQAGVLEVLPIEGPLTLFVFGAGRVVPVRVTGMTITEDAHDNLLNPVRARVELTMTVLSYHDLPWLHPGSVLFMAHQIAKEVLATSNVVGSGINLGASLKLF